MPQEEYGSFIYPYYVIPENTRQTLKEMGLLIDISKQFSIVQARLPKQQPLRLAEQFGYSETPKVYGLLDTASLEASGILQVQEQPVLRQKGQGVLIGFLDTGIDYQLDIFRNPDGSSRIVSIWDQTLEGSAGMPSSLGYGRVLSQELLNQALKEPNPLELAPTMDENGHGTFLASIAAGGEQPETGYIGAAPEALIAVVKVRQAPEYLRDYFFVPRDVPAFSEADLLAAAWYLLEEAERLQVPVVLLAGIGTNQGSHMDSEPLTAFLQYNGILDGVAVVAAAGNEAGRGHHYFGQFSYDQSEQDVEIQVAEGEAGFSVELWTFEPQRLSVEILSPIYGSASSTQITGSNSNKLQFILDGTTVYVDTLLTERRSGGQLILMRFEAPSAGVWRIRVRNERRAAGEFHLWLPLTGFIREETRFLRADPNRTIVSPATGGRILTLGAYQYRNNSIWNRSSRGFAVNGIVKPDLVAPGVDVGGVLPGGRQEQRSGTSIAAAHAAGAAAQLLSWGRSSGNLSWMNTVVVTTYLIRGAGQRSDLYYPNPEWGYGTLDVYQAFLNI